MQPNKSPFNSFQEDQALELFSKGYTAVDVFRHLGALSANKTSFIDEEQRALERLENEPSFFERLTRGSKKFTDAIGLADSTSVFGRVIARSAIGNKLIGGDLEASRQFIDAPAGKQIAGAVAQTASIPAGIALTGGSSLFSQMAVGAGLGYIYDVGSDFAAGKESNEALMPGAETVAGAVIPAGLRGLSALGQTAKSVVKEGIDTASGALSSAKDTVSSVVNSLPTTGIGQKAREFAGRFPRAIRRIGEYVNEGEEIAKRKFNAPAPVVKAFDEGIPIKTIDFVQTFDTPTKKAAIEMMDLADAPRGSALPQTVPGRIAGEQMSLIEKQKRKIGKQIGDFSDSLPITNIDISPTIKQLDDALAQGGIKVKNNTLVFDDPRITKNQRNLIQEMYNEATSRKEMTPKQIHQIDQLFSKLQREARFQGIEDVMIDVPTPDGTVTVPIQKVFRDIFGQKLDEIAEQAGRADIRQLNRDYRSLKNLQDNVESTIVRQSKLEGVNVDPSESASVALRRLFSETLSRPEYKTVYDQLDAMARALGYNGARADTLMDFYLTDLKPLYPNTVQQASLEGSIRSAISSVADRIINLGAPSPVDQRKALRALLES